MTPVCSKCSNGLPSHSEWSLKSLPWLLGNKSKASNLTLVWEVLDLYSQNSDRVITALGDLDRTFNVTNLRSDTMRQNPEPADFNIGRRISRDRGELTKPSWMLLQIWDFPAIYFTPVTTRLVPSFMLIKNLF